jgi:hypothetical protein
MKTTSIVSSAPARVERALAMAKAVCRGSFILHGAGRDRAGARRSARPRSPLRGAACDARNSSRATTVVLLPALAGVVRGRAAMRIVGLSTLGGALALGLLASTLAAGDAEAKSHISVGIGFGFGAPVYAAPYTYEPQPFYYAPAPVYVPPPTYYYYAPPPVVAPPPVYYYEPAPAYYAPRPVYWRHARDDDD